MNARVDLWRIDIERCGHLVTAGVLSESERQRAARFRFARDARTFRVVRCVLREILSRYTGVAAGALKIEAGAFGKPFVALDGAPHFNVSHTRSAALLAISQDCPIGVDVEWMEPLEPAEMRSIAALAFSAASTRALAATEDANLRARFYDAWVRKEARLKAEGSGFGSPTSTADQAWHTRAVQVFADYAAAVCLPVAQFDLTIQDAQDAIGPNVSTRVA